ncbi:MAG TPA: glycosyl hydrolase family 39 [Blastocatellia bacterium]|nr:glycosyl hydrolase family 39 [Blastocatellia bacterium]
MTKLFRRIVASVLVALVLCLSIAPAETPTEGKTEISLDASAPTRPFPHFWERMFGSGRAILTLRDSYRRDLREVKGITGFEYVRFHAIFHDEVGLYSEDASGNPVYNFSYVDQIYDGLIENGVRPFVELSFMPNRLASSSTPHPFWYRPNPSPPRDWNKWSDMIYRFAQHLVERYGIDEVAQWYFEVWNEPNIDFWTGQPKEETYYKLYDLSAQALKRVSPKIRVGGPATAQAAWVDRFIKHCVEDNVPVDFVSTHVYGNDSAKDVFGTNEHIPRDQMVYRAVVKVHDQVKASAMPNLPIIWSEFNASYSNELPVTDSPFIGPWLANTIRQCDGLVDVMSYWTFSDVFEEGGVVKRPFYGGFGLIGADHIPKASFNVFKLLHELGTKRIILDSGSTLATVRSDGSLAIAVWNYAPPEEEGTARTFDISIKGLAGRHRAEIEVIDRDHGSSLAAWEKMGRPDFPSRQQIDALRKAAALPRPRVEDLNGNPARLSLTLEPHALALITVSRGPGRPAVVK